MSEAPALGRFGKELLARDWKAILENLPRVAEARAQLKRSEGGAEAYALCRRGVYELLRSSIRDAGGPEDVLRFRRLASERLRRLRPAG